MRKDKLIAVTGGIGSGKTTALNALKNAGYGVVSCDETTKELYKKRRTKKCLKKLFPSAVSGKIFLTIDKKELSKIVFLDKNENKKLTDYTTPLIFKKTIKKARKKRGKVFVEVPLLFEKGYEKEFDEIIVILRDKTERIESVISRSNLTKVEVEKRIESQIDYDSLDLSKVKTVKNGKDKQKFVSEVLDLAKKL